VKAAKRKRAAEAQAAASAEALARTEAGGAPATRAKRQRAEEAQGEAARGDAGAGRAGEVAYAYVTDCKLVAETLLAVGTASLRRTLEQWVQDHNWRSEGRAGPGRAKKKNAEPKCEDCMVKIAHFRLEAGPRRWCPGCAQAHPGAVVRRSASLCEDCNIKASNFGVRIDERVERRWCGVCAKAHEGAVSADKRRKVA
jgi:hypothetical protein